MPQFDFFSFPEFILFFLIFFWFAYIFYIQIQLLPYLELLKFRKKIYNLTYFLKFDREKYPKTIYSKFFFK